VNTGAWAIGVTGLGRGRSAASELVISIADPMIAGANIHRRHAIRNLRIIYAV
jgi:hypothetical protein